MILGPLSWLYGAANATEQVPIELEGVGISEKLGNQLTLETPFVDENGKNVVLKNYFNGKLPVVLLLVYYECPHLCTFVLNEFLNTLNQSDYEPGKHFQVVTVSIDEREGSELAKQKKESYLATYKKRGPGDDSWHFLTGTKESIDKIASEVGFGFKYDKRQDDFAHAASLFILTPEGKIARYLYGINYPPRDLKLALLEAAEGKIGSIMDKLLMFCYHYDPQGKKYALLATKIMRAGGLVTVVALVVFLYALSRRKKKYSQRMNHD